MRLQTERGPLTLWEKLQRDVDACRSFGLHPMAGARTSGNTEKKNLRAEIPLHSQASGLRLHDLATTTSVAIVVPALKARRDAKQHQTLCTKQPRVAPHGHILNQRLCRPGHCP